VALLTAGAEPRVRAVVTWASVSHWNRWPPEVLAEWRACGYIEVENARTKQVFRLTTDLLDDLEAHGHGRLNIERAVRALAARGVPMLIVHGDGDESVPIGEGRDLAGWGGGELRVISGANHTFGAVHPFRGRTPDLGAVMSETVAFFRRHVAPDGVEHP
jgi:pimeloyl-ACP methyl ester carboxylesterase